MSENHNDAVQAVVIKSVAEFIAYIEKHPFRWWRGESKDYGDTRLTAAFFRKPEPEFLVNDFYRQVFPQITPNEEKHFLAFAQHYGIKTNIIDITENPLVALWFSCETDNADDGVVFGFKGERYDFFDLTEAISTDMFWKREKPNFTNLPADKLMPAVEKIYGLENALALYYDLLASDYESIKSHPGFETGIFRQTEPIANIYSLIYGAYPANPASDKKYIKIQTLYNTKSSKEASKELMALLDLPLKNIIDNPRDYMYEFLYSGVETIFKLLFNRGYWEIFPNFIYRPLLSFDRAVRQKGAFLFQWLCYKGDDIPYVPPIKYHSEIIIPSNSKHQILDTLKTIDINRATIFGDFDNIAKSLQYD
jgi:hypothetical protein